MKIYFPILSILVLTFNSCNNGMGNNHGTSSQTEFELPTGFSLDIFAEVKNARGIAIGDNGTVFVGSRDAGNVYALSDNNKDGKADEVIIIDEGLRMPAGVSYYKGDLYVSAVSRIFRYPDIENNLKDPERELVSDAFPTDSHHGWKFIDFGPDGNLYVPVGAPCNICKKDPGEYANIMRMNADGRNLEVYAYGVRNTVGFAWHPETSELWFTENGRDWMGDHLPPCELNYAPQQGLHFGFPYCHGSDVPDPKFGDERDCTEFVKPEWNFKAHVAPLGMCFYTGDMFPPEYKNQAFVALHGSWNRSTKVGYEVVLVKFKNEEEVESVETFLGGMLNGSEVRGRPVDILQMPDGSILVSDDHAGKVYRIVYTG